MTNGSDAIVEIAGLSIATLGGKRVIDDLSIEILAGENRALVGESAFYVTANNCDLEYKDIMSVLQMKIPHYMLRCV